MKTQSHDTTPTIGVVIPAFNEDKNLRPVLDIVCAIPWIYQIVVVDDGSTDNTYAVAKQAAVQDTRVVPIRLPENQGKAGAMLHGVRTLQTDFVIFLDADLKGIFENHLLELCAPLQSNECDMTIATFQHGKPMTDASHRVTPYLTGQRCLHRSVAEQVLMPLAGARYGVEMGLTIYAKQHGWRVQKIIWRGVTHKMKEQKRNGLPGIKSRWEMYGQILAVAIPARNSHRIQRYANSSSFFPGIPRP
jgi:glycosyltransferase involved in cell wall biosynthesis